MYEFFCENCSLDIDILTVQVIYVGTMTESGELFFEHTVENIQQIIMNSFTTSELNKTKPIILSRLLNE